MSTRRIPMMTEDEIQTELGWIRPMIYSLLHAPDSGNDRPGKSGGYRCELYKRERVLAVAQSPEGQAAQRRWDATLRSSTPNNGWTPRLGDIGRQLGITAVGAGRILDLMGYRSHGCVTDSAMVAGLGVPRWNGFTMQNDWHLDRVLVVIRTAVQDTEKPAIADALAAAIAKQEAREWVAARKRGQAETEAARRQEEHVLISGLEAEVQALRAADAGMSLLTAVEFATPDPSHRIALYRRCAEDGDVQARGLSQGDPRLLKIAPPSTLDLAFLKRRARAEGFQVQGFTVTRP
jgi:hypothetical protein